MAAALCDGQPVVSFALAVDTLSRPAAEQQPGVHMVAPEPGDPAELSRATGIYGAVFAVGVDGV